MMQMRDWISGLFGIIIGAMGLLSIMNILPFELTRAVLLWIVVIAGAWLLYSAIIEITNSNVIGTVSLIVAIVAILISVLPIVGWITFGFLGDIFYKIVLVAVGAFLAIATFAMEL